MHAWEGEGEQSWLHPKQQEDLLQSVCTWDRCCSKWRWTTDTKLLPLTCLRAAAAAEALSQRLSDTSTVIYPPLWWWRRLLSGLPCAAVWRQIELHICTPLKASAVCFVHLLRSWTVTQTRSPISWLFALITFLIEMSTCLFNCLTIRKGESAQVELNAKSGELHLYCNLTFNGIFFIPMHANQTNYLILF